MTLQPGESTEVAINFTMTAGMGGPHDFRIHLLTNDPVQEDVELTVLSDWIE